MSNKTFTHIQGNLLLLHKYSTDKDTFIDLVNDLISEYQLENDTEVIDISDEEFDKFLDDKVHNEILMRGNNDE